LFSRDVPGGVARAQTNYSCPSSRRHGKLADVAVADCACADTNSQTYYLVSSTGRREQTAARGGRITSKIWIRGRGRTSFFETPTNFWSRRGIWAPELTLTTENFTSFDIHTDELLPEQWRDWNRGKARLTILAGDSRAGRSCRSQIIHVPTDMMTLDGTFWIEDGVPFMVFSHEWVQITDGRWNTSGQG